MLDEPPSTFPRGQNHSRSAAWRCGTVWYAQSASVLKRRENVAGMWISGRESGPPASSRSTRVSGSSVSRWARMHPALPAPTMT